MNILITGSSGFIGTHLVKYLTSFGHRVIGVDFKLPTFGCENFISYNEYIEKHRKLKFKEELKKVDTIIHLAAFKSVPISIKKPDLYLEENVNSTKVLLDLAKEYGVKRFIFASSSSIYGDDPGNIKFEGFTGRPLSPYAASKRICELLIEQYGLHYEVDYINLRFFNIYGEGNKGNVFDIFKNSPSLKLFGNCKRDFTHVSDVIGCIYKSIFAPGSALNNVYNVGTGKAKSVEDIALKYNKKIERQDFREGDIFNSTANIDKARKFLGYDPKNTEINWEGIL